MHINVVHLIGYLGKNPEHKSVKASDRKYAVLSLATQRSWKGADEEWHSKTEWHRVVVIWNQGNRSTPQTAKCVRLGQGGETAC